jgi:hypothetical protein
MALLVVARLAAMRGRYGSQAVPAEDQLIAASDVDKLEALVKQRMREAAADGRLRAVPRVVEALRVWRVMGDNGAVARWVEAETVDDARLVGMLPQFVRFTTSSGMGDRVSRRTPYAPMKLVEEFFDVDALVKRLRTLTRKPAWTDAERAAMRLILDAYDAREAGRDGETSRA